MNFCVVVGGIGVDVIFYYLCYMVCFKYGENFGKLVVYLDVWGVGEVVCDGIFFELFVIGDVCSIRVVVLVENKFRVLILFNVSGLRVLIGSILWLE